MTGEAVDFHHIPVLKTEVLDALHVQNGKKYIDTTLGGGGHTREILNSGGIVLGIDQDLVAVTHIKQNFQFLISNSKLTLAQGNFSEIKTIAKENGFSLVSGILFDLGVSSFQLDTSGRGFSFRYDEPLDMRMGSEDLTAEDVVNRFSEEELVEILQKYGEEESSSKIAREIIIARAERPIKTTKDLVHIIEKAKKRTGMIHPATKTFQAIRMYVNHEMESLEKGLQNGMDILESGGRMVVISFHSLEDRMVKRTFQSWERNGYVQVITKKPVEASEKEKQENSRSRSAKLRIIEKL